MFHKPWYDFMLSFSDVPTRMLTKLRGNSVGLFSFMIFEKFKVALEFKDY